jgi:hypothetical protein
MPDDVVLRPGPMRASNYTLDHFVAHRLSELTVCGAPELGVGSSTWLNRFILSTIFTTRLEGQPRAYLFNFFRRAEAAISAYNDARNALKEQVAARTGNHISSYFKALLYFEVCLSQYVQAWRMLETGTKSFIQSGSKPPERPIGFDRVSKLHRVSKHMDERIEGGQLPPNATSAIWITNEGLISVETKVLFSELCELLTQTAAGADFLLAKLSAGDAA